MDQFRHPFKLNNACCALTCCGRTASLPGQVIESQVAALAVDARKATVTEADNIRSILMFGKIKYLCKVVSNKAEQEEQQAQNEKEKIKKGNRVSKTRELTIPIANTSTSTKEKKIVYNKLNKEMVDGTCLKVFQQLLIKTMVGCCDLSTFQ